MTLPSKNIFNPTSALVDANGNATQLFRDYMIKLDALVAAIVAGNAPNNLVNAANDAAAQAAGVQIGQFYRNGSVYQVRVV